MKIQILGTGCPKCKQLTANAEAAVAALGIEATIEKVQKIDEIMAFGVMITPALVVDGVVKSAGKVLSPEDIKKFLTKCLSPRRKERKGFDCGKRNSTGDRGCRARGTQGIGARIAGVRVRDGAVL